MDEYIRQYISYLKDVAGYSEKTAVSYEHDLRRLETWLNSHGMDVSEMAEEDARAFTVSLYEEKLSAATINRILSANRSFFHNLCETGVVRIQPFKSVKRAKQGRRIPVVLTSQEIDMLLNHPWDDYTSLMEVTMFNMFYSTGCRLSELTDMKISDINIEGRRAIVTGKGNKQRYVFLTEKAVFMLGQYLPERSRIMAQAEKEDDGTLLVNKKGKKLPLSTIHIIFDRYREELGLTKKFTPHVFRHTFATHLLDNDADIRIVQELLGHESIGTTQIYTHVTGKRLEKIYRDAHPHGRKD